MSLSHLEKNDRLSFQVYISQDEGEIKKVVKFNSLLNGIKYVFGNKILGAIASDEISIYDTVTKKKLVRGDIYTIYEKYLETFPRSTNISVDDFMIDILDILSKLNLDAYSEMKNNPVVKSIMRINTNYARKLLNDI